MASLSFGIFFIRRLGTFRYLLHGKSRLIWRPGFVSVWPRSPHIYATGANNTNTANLLAAWTRCRRIAVVSVLGSGCKQLRQTTATTHVALPVQRRGELRAGWV